MSQNKISAALTAAAIANITAAIAVIRTNVPFLINLTDEQRQHMPSVTEASQGLVLSAINFVAQHPEAIPANFNTVEFNKDGALLSPLQQVTSLINQLNFDFGDTMKVLHGDLYSEFLDIYAFAKAGNRNGAYDDFINTAKTRFSSGPHKKASPIPHTP